MRSAEHHRHGNCEEEETEDEDEMDHRQSSIETIRRIM
jgi:hypothetical protein